MFKICCEQAALVCLSFALLLPSDNLIASEASEDIDGKGYQHKRSLDIEDKQIRVIQAKIFSRKGLYIESLKIYKSLRKDFPNDEVIWVNYIDTMVNFSDHVLALIEVDKLLRKNPLNLDAKRTKARIYYERGKYKWTYDIYEDILRQGRKDWWALSDYASSKSIAGEWADALSYFSRVLEHDPENKAVLQSISEIQIEHRPRLDAGYKSYIQTDDNIINTSSVTYTRHITNNTLFSLDYDHITVDRPTSIRFETNSLDLSIDDTMFRFQRQFNKRWKGEVGAGYYTGLDGGFSFHAGMGYKVLDNSWLQADYLQNRPWYDPLEAANFDGSKDKISFAYNWGFLKVWDLYLGVERLDYFLDGFGDYGRERSFTGVITRRFETPVNIPDFYLGYSFYRAIFDYEERDFRPVGMIKAEQRHSIFLNIEHKISKHLAVTLSGSVSNDVDRELKGWSYSPGVEFTPGKRFGFTFRYNFSSESGNLGGGETNTFGFLIKAIF